MEFIKTITHWYAARIMDWSMHISTRPFTRSKANVISLGLSKVIGHMQEINILAHCMSHCVLVMHTTCVTCFCALICWYLEQKDRQSNIFFLGISLIFLVSVKHSLKCIQLCLPTLPCSVIDYHVNQVKVSQRKCHIFKMPFPQSKGTAHKKIRNKRM